MRHTHRRWFYQLDQTDKLVRVFSYGRRVTQQEASDLLLAHWGHTPMTLWPVDPPSATPEVEGVDS